MTGQSAAQASIEKQKCARCHRPFTPKKEGQQYGPTCARKLAGQVELDSQALVSGMVLHRYRGGL